MEFKSAILITSPSEKLKKPCVTISNTNIQIIIPRSNENDFVMLQFDCENYNDQVTFDWNRVKEYKWSTSFGNQNLEKIYGWILNSDHLFELFAASTLTPANLSLLKDSKDSKIVSKYSMTVLNEPLNTKTLKRYQQLSEVTNAMRQTYKDIDKILNPV